MIQIMLTVNNRMPLNFRASRSPESAATLLYIPGVTLLGGLAAAHQRLRRDPKEFADFFTSGKIRFGNLYPANFQVLTGHDLPVLPLPATAYTCKRFEGFRFDNQSKEKDKEERHGIVDTLIRWALFKLDQEKATEFLRQTEKCGCQTEWGVCPESLEPVSAGKFYRQNAELRAFELSKVDKRLLTRTGISRERGVVAEQILYNREVLEEEQTFWGRLTCDDANLWEDQVTNNEDLQHGFKEFLETASGQELIYVGGNKSRGLGQIVKGLPPLIEHEETPQRIKDRVLIFTQTLKTMAAELKIETRHDLYIPMTLRADVIVRDALLRFQTTLSPEYFQVHWNLNGLTQIYQALRTRRVMGWNAFLRLPKTDDLAIGMGSVFLFGYAGSVDDSSLWQTLCKIQTTGIGERRCEGFGDLTIADPFHLEVKPV